MDTLIYLTFRSYFEKSTYLSFSIHEKINAKMFLNDNKTNIWHFY